MPINHYLTRVTLPDGEELLVDLTSMQYPVEGGRPVIVRRGDKDWSYYVGLEPGDPRDGSAWGRAEYEKWARVVESSIAKSHAFDESEHPRHGKGSEEGGRFAPKEGGSERKASGGRVAEEKAEHLAGMAAERGHDALAGKLREFVGGLPDHVAEAVSSSVASVTVMDMPQGGTYGAKGLAVSFKVAGGGSYKVWDSLYKEETVIDLDTTIVHELGHAAHASLSAEDRKSFRALTGWADGKELEASGVKRVPVEMPAAFRRRREFRPGGVYDWAKIGWTYEGYRRVSSPVQTTVDSRGRVRVESISTPVARTMYLPVGSKRPPTEYGGANSQEEFAEAFQLYHRRPEALKERRPDMDEWMGRWHVKR